MSLVDQKSYQKYELEAEHSVDSTEDFRNKHYFTYRLAEIFPGALVWGFLFAMVALSFFQPIWAAVIMLIYVLSWLFRAVRFTWYLVRAYYPFVRSMNVRWQQKFEQNKDLAKQAEDIYHVILAATYKEEYETLARALRILTKTTYPKDKIIFVLATEERDHDNATVIAHKLKQEFGSKFKEFVITEHPAEIAGEVKGKGGNISWAGRVIRDHVLNDLKLDPKKVLMTSIDADHRLHPEYLSALTYTFLKDKKPELSSYVSVALFFNNVWDVPSFVRFIHFSSTFWMLTTSVWTSRLHNVMTQTQTLSALMKTDFYSTTSIVEDGHQYWRSMFKFGPKYTVKMVLMPVYSDAVLTDTYFGTLREQYLQRRRWHYGISDFPFVLTHFLFEKSNRNVRVFVDMIRHLEGHFSLATSSFMLGIIGWLPIFFGGIDSTAFGLNFKIVYTGALRYALVGLLASIIVAVSLVPPKKRDKPWSKLYLIWDYLILPLQIPASIILASSVPSLDSHTRLMLGKYLGFRVTKKAVSKNTDLKVN